MHYIKEYSSNSLMCSLYKLCIELEKQSKEKRDTQDLYDAISDIADLLLSKTDILEESDYNAVLEIANEYELDVNLDNYNGYNEYLKNKGENNE